MVFIRSFFLYFFKLKFFLILVEFLKKVFIEEVFGGIVILLK